jgi:hypothetical protein
MSQRFWNALKASPVVLGAFLLLVNSASAAQTVAGKIADEPTEAADTKKNTEVVELAAEFGTQLSPAGIQEFNLSHLNSSESNFTGSEKPVAELNAQLPQTRVEQLNRPASTPLEIGSSVDESDSTLAQAMPRGEDATTGSTDSLEPLNLDNDEESADSPMGQVTNVSQLSDVSPGDWAYEALRSLVERYGCIAGYPDGTFRGNRAMTRYEFAAGLNACLQQVERLIATATTDFVRREDLETLQRLTQEFQGELTTLGTRLDTLENNVAFLEDNRFTATTTKLLGSADFGILDAWGDRRAVPSGQIPTEDFEVNPFLPGRVSLSFDTTFTGRDLLRTKFEAGNFTPLDASVTGTDMTLYDFDTRTGPTGNDVVLSTLFYKFPIGDRIEVFLAPQGVASNDIAPQLNPAGGGLSRFGQRNPIYRLSDGAGFGANIRLSDALLASFSYLSSPGIVSNPAEERGLFEGYFGAMAQLTFSPSDRFELAFTYVRFYSPEPGGGVNVTGNTGSQFAQTPFGDDTATSANAYGIETRFRVTPNFAIGGWVGFTQAYAESNGLFASKGDEAEVWNYAIAAAFRDFGKPGNALGFIFGMPPRMRGNDVIGRRDLDTSYRVEGFYRYQVTDNIAITPSFFVIFNPEHNNANDTISVGTLLTTFTF